MRITKFIPALAVPLLAIACSELPTATVADEAPLFSATSDWQEFIIDVEWTFYNLCLQEDLHGTGQSLVRRHTVTNDHDTRWTFLVRLVEGTWQLEGMTTGHIWLPVPGGGTHSTRSPSGTFWHSSERFVFENQTTGQVLDWPYKYHFVTNANGEVKVDRVVFDRCTLRH